MNMADLISERRKAKGMTQKQLGDKLGVTDKAISKWERGNSYPDISYLEPLANELDTSISELLKGKDKETSQEFDNEEDKNETIVKKTLDYANNVYEARSKNIPRIILFTFLMLGFLAIMTVSIVDFALNNNFTWSLLPISAIIFS